MKIKLLSTALLFSALSIPRIAAGAEEDTGARSQSATEELKKSGQHLWRATRIAAEKTKNEIKKAAQNLRESTENVRKQSDEKLRSKGHDDSRSNTPRHSPVTDSER